MEEKEMNLHNYKYIPDSYNYNLINDKFMTKDEFVAMQVLYRNAFEKIMNNYIDFANIDNYIESNGSISKIDDEEYNFYHRYSTLGSKYIFLRNNYHVEELTTEEINSLKEGNIDGTFFSKTLSKVMFEKGDSTFFGTPIVETSSNSKSLVFEFSYDQSSIESIEDLKKIDSIKKEVFKMIESNMKKVINAPISFITYNGIPDIYRINEDSIVK